MAKSEMKFGQMQKAISMPPHHLGQTEDISSPRLSSSTNPFAFQTPEARSTLIAQKHESDPYQVSVMNQAQAVKLAGSSQSYFTGTHATPP